MIIKVGLVRRRSIETLLSKIEPISVDQGVFGRMFGYGTIVISGTGGPKEPFTKIVDPMMFRRTVQEQIDSRDSVNAA